MESQSLSRSSTGVVVGIAALVALVVLTFATPALAHPPGKVARLLAVARRQIGVPYVPGAESPGAGFDCSGLVQYAFRQVDVKLPRTTWSMLRRGKHVRRWQLRPGDVVFFWGGDHVAIYLGRGRFIDSPRTGSRVGIRTLASYGGFFTARRFLPS